MIRQNHKHAERRIRAWKEHQRHKVCQTHAAIVLWTTSVSLRSSYAQGEHRGREVECNSDKGRASIGYSRVGSWLGLVGRG